MKRNKSKSKNQQTWNERQANILRKELHEGFIKMVLSGNPTSLSFYSFNCKGDAVIEHKMPI